MKINYKQAKEFNRIMKAKSNSRKAVKQTQSLLEDLTREKRNTFSKSDFTNLQKFLEKDDSLIMKDFISHSGNRILLIKDNSRVVQIKYDNLKYCLINNETKDIHVNFGKEALGY